MNKAIFALPVVVLSLTAHLAFASAEDDAERAANTEKAKQAAEAAFKAADTNGDGGLSKDELAKTTRFQFNLIKANFDKIDTNKDGKVTSEERDVFIEAQRAKKK